MVDNLTIEARSRLMSRVGPKNTKPEMVVRRIAHALGYRFRLHRKDLPGSPDLVFPSHKKVVFVHGCYWHRHSCKLATTPKTNITYWQRKFTDNIARDQRNLSDLSSMGWESLVVWQCETRDMAALKQRLLEFLGRQE